MRQFDTYQSYLDNLGEPLVGRVRFCLMNATPSSVFDADGNALPNPILTDNAGRLCNQVFLEDHDYLVFFEKYVGHAVMAEDVEEDSWEPVGSAINRYNTVGVNVEVDGGVQAVATIGDLRDMNPDVNSGYIMVLGYEKRGDKPSVSYVWKKGSSKAEDGGSVIASNVEGFENGRWILVQSFDYVDVRHFGAFPMSSAEPSVNQRYSLQMANAYAEKVGLRLYLTADDTEFYYDVGGMTLNNVDCSSKARVFNAGNTNAILSNVVCVYSLGNVTEGANGKIVVRGDTLKTSFNTKGDAYTSLEPTEMLVFDTDYNGIREFSVSGVECKLLVDQTGVRTTFTNCTFSGPGKFAKETILFFDKCELRESMFESFSSGYVSTAGCYTTISQWQDMHKYVDFMLDNGYLDINLESKDVSGDIVAEGKDFTLRNCSVDGTITCRDFKGVNVKATKIIAENYDLNNCETIIDGNLGTFKAVDCSFTVGNVYVGRNTRIRNCTFGGSYTSMFTIAPVNGQIINTSITENTFIDVYLRMSAREYGAEDFSTNVFVNSFIFVNNKTTNFFQFEKKYNDQGFVDKDSLNYFSEVQGYYKIEGNYSDSGKVWPSTKVDSMEMSNTESPWKFRYDATLQKIYTTLGDGMPLFSFRNLVWNFGEKKNLVKYGIDGLTVVGLGIYWESLGGVSGYWTKDKEGISDYDIEVLAEDGYSHLDVNIFNDLTELSPSSGSLPTNGVKNTQLEFRIRPYKKSETFLQPAE